MPSIEVICIGQSQPSDFAFLPFAVVAETELVSHRGHSSLFQQDFDQVQGCIYHLGNPRLKDPNASGAYFASDLLMDSEEGFEFRAAYISSVKKMLEELLSSSPEGRLLFTSDYQFGPHPGQRFLQWKTLDAFWQLHDAKKLRMNALYRIQKTL